MFTPDVFAPHLLGFERDILRQYADVPLAGACKDEWGFPGRFEPRTDDLYCSRFMAEAYAHRRPGRDLLRDAGIEPQTPCTMHQSAGFASSMMPQPNGQSHLQDGTVILASGVTDVMGDPIRKRIQVAGHEVFIDAMGVAAVRLNRKGNVIAMAAGGLKTFASGDVRIDLAERIDVALWRDTTGRWQGLLQGYEGEVPPSLRQLTSRWLRLRLPVPWSS